VGKRVIGEGAYLTVGEAVERLNAEPRPVPIKGQTLRRMAERGEVPTIRIGLRRDRRFPAAAVEALKERLWAEAHPDEPGSPPAPPPAE
jgi:excisionase family DNA binding protein